MVGAAAVAVGVVGVVAAVAAVAAVDIPEAVASAPEALAAALQSAADLQAVDTDLALPPGLDLEEAESDRAALSSLDWAAQDTDPALPCGLVFETVGTGPALPAAHAPDRLIGAPIGTGRAGIAGRGVEAGPITTMSMTGAMTPGTHGEFLSIPTTRTKFTRCRSTTRRSPNASGASAPTIR